jgi:phosphoribosylanthranilate isomerase
MMVKICGITSLEDARAAVDAGAGALGFNFYPASPRYLDPDDAAAIAAAVRGSVCTVGVFVLGHGVDAEEAATRLGLDVAQIHGPGPRPRTGRYWRAVAAGAPLEDEEAEAFLVDAPSAGQYGGTGRTFDWALARYPGKRVVLAGGLDASNVGAAIATARPWGVDACSGLESAPGRKDHRKMAAFIAAALAAST